MMLEARDLSVTGRLSGVSTRIVPGQVIAICGPNGAGKSTLLQAMAGLLAPGAGQVMLDGEPLGAIHPRARTQAIGYLPQTGEVAWDVAVASLVALGRLPHGDHGEGCESAVAAAMAACDLEHLASRPMSTLSGGEKARVLLARVLAGCPRWILADEPLAALDLAHQLAMLRLLRSEADKGTGVVMVLHDLAMAMNHAGRVLVLDRGKLVADGAPEQALAEPMIRQVWGVEARWLGAPCQRALIIDR